MAEKAHWWSASEEYTLVPDEDEAVLAQRLHDEGLLYAINRLVLHPLGLALGVKGTRRGEHYVQANGLALFASDDPEGIVYAEDGQHERALAKLEAAGHADLCRRLFAMRTAEKAEPAPIDASAPEHGTVR